MVGSWFGFGTLLPVAGMRNEDNYHNSSVPFKIMSCDPGDDVIDTHSSLMTGVALKAVEKKIGKKVKLNSHYMIMSKDEMKTFFKAVRTFFKIYEGLCLSSNEDDEILQVRYNDGNELIEEAKGQDALPNMLRGKSYA